MSECWSGATGSAGGSTSTSPPTARRWIRCAPICARRSPDSGRAPAMPIYSTVTGDLVAGGTPDAAYWVGEPALAGALLARRAGGCST